MAAARPESQALLATLGTGSSPVASARAAHRSCRGWVPLHGMAQGPRVRGDSAKAPGTGLFSLSEREMWQAGTEVPFEVLFAQSNLRSCGFGWGFLTGFHSPHCCGLGMENKPFGLSYLRLQQQIFFFSSPQVLTLPSSLQISQPPDTWALSACTYPCSCSEGEHKHRNWRKVQAKKRFFPALLLYSSFYARAGQAIKPTGGCRRCQRYQL